MDGLESINEILKKEQDSSSSEATFESQPKAKPKRTYKRKEEKPLIALKTCKIRLEDGTVDLVKGQPVVGLKSQELKNLKKHKFVE